MIRPLTVLLVEDNPADVRLATEAMHGTAVPCDLRVARTGAEALDLVRHHHVHPDLIILDLEMPGVTGLEVLAELGAEPDLRIIPVAVLSATDDDDIVRRAYELGANCYVTKPHDLEKFVRTVSELEEFWCRTVRLPTVGAHSGPSDGPSDGREGVRW